MSSCLSNLQQTNHTLQVLCLKHPVVWASILQHQRAKDPTTQLLPCLSTMTWGTQGVRAASVQRHADQYMCGRVSESSCSELKGHLRCDRCFSRCLRAASSPGSKPAACTCTGMRKSSCSDVTFACGLEVPLQDSFMP